MFLIINEWSDNRTIMGRKAGFTASQKSVDTSELAKGKSKIKILKNIGRYHRTVMNFVEDLTEVRNRADKGQSRVVSKRSLSRIKREAVMKSGLTRRELFNRIGATTVTKTPDARFGNRSQSP